MINWHCRVMLADPGHPTTPYHHQPSTLCAGCCMHCCTPKLCSQHMRCHRVPAQAAVPPHLQFRNWEHHQLVPALTTAPRQDLETRTPPTQPH